ncbi:hypothetical protein [Bradyrhizobium sp. RDI18]|uniref:hypothetical protein n=1 Tax=Bradyrhizobium sp. RDI18 TaxID=3367400 RepID=UPI003719D1A9
MSNNPSSKNVLPGPDQLIAQARQRRAEALANNLPPPRSAQAVPSKEPSQEQESLDRLVREQQRTNLLLAIQPLLLRPVRTIMGLFLLWIIIKAILG